MCAVCARPVSLCFCAHVSPQKTRTRVVVLQHPREAKVPLGTLRMVQLSLPEAVVRRGVDFNHDPVVEALYREEPSPYVLYPGADARDLSEIPPGEPITLIAIDGTWSQAKALLRHNPRLAALPRVAFTPGSPSIYRIRRQPAEHCVSTLEALARALDLLEGPSPGHFESALLAPLRALVSDQLRLTAERPSYRTRRARGPRPPLLPKPDSAALLGASWEHLVCAQGEANAWPANHPEAGEHELVQWHALRLATGEEFSATIRPRQALGPDTTNYTELPPEAFLAGEDWESFTSRWAAFLRPDDVLATWGHFHSALNADLMPAERIDVRIAAARVLSKRSGRVEQCAERFGLKVEPKEPGRCARRLSVLAAILHRLREHDRRPAPKS